MYQFTGYWNNKDFFPIHYQRYSIFYAIDISVGIDTFEIYAQNLIFAGKNAYSICRIHLELTSMVDGINATSLLV